MPRHSSASDVFHAIADSGRRAMLDYLATEEAAASVLAKEAGLSSSAASQHLNVLRQAGLVRSHERGRERIYRLCPAQLRAVHDWSSRYERFWRQSLTRLHDVLDRDRQS
jgi:DNA-binding transcriptional ArsR family regulator